MTDETRKELSFRVTRTGGIKIRVLKTSIDGNRTNNDTKLVYTF